MNIVLPVITCYVAKNTKGPVCFNVNILLSSKQTIHWRQYSFVISGANITKT